MMYRKVSYEERIEIINYYISNNYDYKGTANKILTNMATY